MEELQSTEILDREILEDARKKAFRILKTADDTVKAKSTEWEKKITAVLSELEKKYAGQCEAVTAEIMARLPMDKRRSRAEKIESLLVAVVEQWYAGLGRQRVLSLLETDLSKRLAVFCGGAGTKDFSAISGREPPRVLLHKLDRAAAESILESVLPGQHVIIAEEPSAALYPEIIIENSQARISASIGKTVDFFLHEKRAELVTALLGEKITEEAL
jgi:hypothetical protein